MYSLPDNEYAYDFYDGDTMNRRRKVFERVVNPLISKYMIDPFNYNGPCIASSYQLNI